MKEEEKWSERGEPEERVEKETKGRQLLFWRDCCKASKKNTCDIVIEIFERKTIFFIVWLSFWKKDRWTPVERYWQMLRILSHWGDAVQKAQDVAYQKLA